MLHPSNSTLPPMLRQYLEYKQVHTDALLFFQVGDFYELFFEDAVFVAGELNLTLTSRDKSALKPIPMCGVPMGAVEGYLMRLVQAGHSVAVVSQKPVPAGFKGMVPRFLERVITPGVQLLGNDSHGHGVVAAVAFESSEVACIALTDVQSGAIRIEDAVRLSQVVDVLESRLATEVVIYGGEGDFKIDRRQTEIRLMERSLGNRLKWRGSSFLTEGSFDAVTGFQLCAPSVKRSVRLLLNYLEESMINVNASGMHVEFGGNDQLLVIDAVTRANLEIDKTFRNQAKDGSLWGALDACVTSAGSRLLRARLCMPFAETSLIEQRWQAVQAFFESEHARETVRRYLTRTVDLGRIATRVALGVVTPRELGCLRDTLNVVDPLKRDLSGMDEFIDTLLAELPVSSAGLELLQSALTEDLPPTLKDGGVIRTGYHSEVDRLRQLASGGQAWFENFAEEERRKTGISSLKVKHNNVLGYFIEVTTANSTKVPDYYEPRQSTTNSRRYVVSELKAAEAEYFSAQSRLIELEKTLLSELVQVLSPYVGEYRTVANSLAELDVLATAAEVAQREGYVRPFFSDQAALRLRSARHPVLSQKLGSQFVPNSLEMGVPEGGKVVIVTGPNMGGKSTYLRQAALVTIMAQAGWFVPAEMAEVVLVDRIFARLGANDNLLEGESTFMVEMREAASIVAQATANSLVVVDEIGRGTSTTDGVALAQAILEWIANESQCYCLFATHYHQLCELASRGLAAGIVNVSVGSKRLEGELVFTHQIVEGAASRSYGLEVARLAGLPDALIARAQTILEQPHSAQSLPNQQVSLFPATAFQSKQQVEEHQQLRELGRKLRNLDPNALSPREALDVVYGLVAASAVLDKAS